MVRAKFKVNKIERFPVTKWDAEKQQNITLPDGGRVQLFPVVGDANNAENAAFFAATPGGQIELSILNPVAIAAFEQGKEYYVDFTLADK